MALTTAVMVWITLIINFLSSWLSSPRTLPHHRKLSSRLMCLCGQVGEANDLLPEIAAKAAKLKVYTLHSFSGEMGNRHPNLERISLKRKEFWS